MRKYLGFIIYLGFVILFIGPIFITPFIAQYSLITFNILHDIYSPFCHQYVERSICYFENNKITDCVRSEIDISNESNVPNETSREKIVKVNGILEYKFPVCARDLAIYGAMVLGGLIFPFVRKIDDKNTLPIIYFIIALIPIALDGGTQLLGFRESTNELRLITGFIAGFPIPFYAIPILNALLNSEKKQSHLNKKSR